MTRIASLRTPDERFAALAGFDYAPHYVDDLPGYEGLRLAWVEAGAPKARDTFLCLHGEPTWSYLYRFMAPVFVDRGARVVAPDLFGFGRSDKPVDDDVYTFDFHRNALLAFVERLDLRHVTLVAQDWGGLLGLTLPMALPGRVDRLLVMNTALGTGEGAPSEGFEAWRAFMASQPDPNVGALLKRAVDGLSDTEAAAYDAPFPDARYKAGVRRFPALVPTSADMPGASLSRAARTWLRDEWHGRVFMAVGMKDPVLGLPVMQHLRAQIAPDAPLMEVAEGGHFVQEHGAGIAAAACDAFGL